MPLKFPGLRLDLSRKLSSEPLLEAALAAAKAQAADTVLRIDSGTGDGLVAFVARVSLEGRISPGFAGFVASAACDSLRRINQRGTKPRRAAKECVVYVERGGLLQRGISQFSFTQTYSTVIACALGDETGRQVIEAVILAASEWREGRYRLFDGDGWLQFKVHVDGPTSRPDRFWHWVEVAGAVLTISFAVAHWVLR